MSAWTQAFGPREAALHTAPTPSCHGRDAPHGGRSDRQDRLVAGVGVDPRRQSISRESGSVTVDTSVCSTSAFPPTGGSSGASHGPASVS
eukprot:2791659-Pyramimonas_sp.AAC.1